ncbi:exonuclease SbcC [Gracilibacillus boraciitolerans JCM 21714]|uniref:Nuclease SbcCD subunit C n=1 Tax=Gracilibacillus boraciitolerans JCM 21714 TaxID=1298598 RepID=W4VE39_9BACI|nr:AAA family ATPase [Gracilibacillus boraciitolerans]GAE91426.1 exonuclease SbcC [Gracilibacillus boraciitolerans JCM 21714]
MRAVELKVQTFGSRQDKQRIDFSHVDEKAYFFITEPKAAHKITLIDAICFSLYGKAPLQDHIVHLLKNSEITYTFWLHQQKYLVTRRPKRKKLIATVERYTEVAASANLQCWNQKDEWNLLHSNIKDVNEAIEKMIGLNYHQFKRMILSPPR